MSDVNTPNTGAPEMGNAVKDAAQAAQAAVKQAGIKESEITPAMAREMIARAKAEGKSVDEIKESMTKGDLKQPEAQGKPQDKKATQAKDPSKEAAKDATEAIKKYKVKVDGQELEVDEAELLRGYSHQRAANKLLQEGKAARKQATEFIEMMKNKESLFNVISKLGHDPRKLAEEFLAAQLQDELMDPREKELRDAKNKLKAIEDMEKKRLEEVERRRTEELKAKYTKDYETQFVSALQESQLPPTKPMVAEMAKYISRSAKIGFKMTPSEAAQLVKEDVQRAQLNLIGNADGETLLKLLGDDVAAKILTARGAKVKNPESKLQTPKEQGQPSEKLRSNKKRMSPKEWREFNRKK